MNHKLFSLDASLIHNKLMFWNSEKQIELNMHVRRIAYWDPI
jgi:hypothetical protein